MHERIENPEKYQAYNLRSVSKNKKKKKKKRIKNYRSELRSVRAQKNAEEFLLQIELLARRIHMLKEKGDPVPYAKIGFNKNKPGEDIRLPNVHKILHNYEVVALFYRYVTETGADWETFKKLLPATSSGGI